ncbi:MAG: hypothetical protein CVU39_14865 [Chloroflexi bacterium HGW-Chloroflexi-10]|nr:MAG: hypothetical protein CVU39_14865 [Chloroflexi bacterium HGW-Chloroflexi-10]
METPDDRVIQQMQALIQDWTGINDSRRIFLSCYQLMTHNTLKAIERDEFFDSIWVNHLLNRFADYYFIALDKYETDPQAAPLVWQLAHNATRSSKALAIQSLLLGVNAHINYDLVLALVDVLAPEWSTLDEIQLKNRYTDHDRVNSIIAATIDAVQDEILEPAMPLMDFIDNLFGRMDERLISSLIRNWRENVWNNATQILSMENTQNKEEYITHVEKDALKIGQLIYRDT